MSSNKAQSLTDIQFSEALNECRRVFSAKLSDYGASWRIMRPQSLTDQIFIKAKRIRSIETKGEAAVNEGILPEFIGIANYGAIAIIQCKLGYADSKDMEPAKALELYDRVMKETTELMLAKNHDYDEAWRSMRVSSFTDIILTKVQRTKEIEDNGGKTLISEGVEANYADMINYALFGIIKLNDKNKED